jgi:gamma-glutamyltranspeptidase/glutathione hydrolase
MDRRDFMKSLAATGAVAASGGLGSTWARAQGLDLAALARKDLKPAGPIEEHIFATGRRLTAAFCQCVLEPTMTSLAGGFSGYFYDAATGELGVGGAGYALPAAEPLELTERDSMTGRAVVIPAWVKGAEVYHAQWCRLSWAEIIEPAIELAEHGFIIDHLLWGWTFEVKGIVGRYPEGRAIWFPEGHMLGVGDTLRQPQLAETLRRLRDDGPDYFYTGAWAKRMVAAVRERGGLMTEEDVANYEEAAISPAWKPGSGEGLTATDYRGFEVGTPDLAMFALGLNLVEAGDLRSRGKPTESAEVLYYQMRIMQEMWHHGFLYTPEIHDQLVSKDYARQLWKLIEGGPPRPFEGFAAGTCGLTVVDADGNVAAGTHSSSSTPYGTGIFVDGVVLNRVIYFRKYKLPAGISTTVWLFKEGRPHMVASTPSRAFTENLLQNVINVVEYGMDLRESVMQPRFGHPDPDFGATQIEGSFSDEIIRAVRKRGIDLMQVAPMYPYMGSCQAVQLDHTNGTISGIADPRRRGMAKGI